MSTNIPNGLKPADINRFATRARQVEKAKPVIWYWCNYWIVNQILSKNLHHSDAECLNFTTGLMDKLEQFKAQHSDNDAVTDDTAGQAYVEQFGLETFHRADNAVQANRASLQTADTFQAAATFLELCQIWGQVDPEIAAKIKFAKFHALRIAKAVKAGEDPNLSNPSPEKMENEGGLPMESNSPSVEKPQDAEMPALRRMRQPSVEEVPDESDSVQRRLAAQSSADESIHPSRSSSRPPAHTENLPQPPSGPPSNIPSPTIPGMMNLDGDLRQRPSHLSQATVPDLPAAPSDFPQGSPISGVGTPTNLGAPPEAFPSLNTFQSFPPPAVASHEAPPSPRASSPKEFERIAHARKPSITPSTVPPPPKPVPPMPAYTSTTGNSVVDEDSMAQAQKHARWAVSALNFDDVNTAVKELRNALRLLGAR
ncbi:hypothetical protein D8B26_004023 [Coccidioides posadasii str. Silveira]|uniref:Uncharacterized protein n=1 Tax=Coccidioides posadasii (strain RMSCC 757 / Silveira) TaxID=443226 RepID=E9DDN6_COCPS|nr:conserved hypothetical protein [Coccidioides posadasii str. Silveira]QVM09362.1 hypothetical protein D8B26_004023 [Coccidioides posadasii str. Silveira]